MELSTGAILAGDRVPARDRGFADVRPRVARAVMGLALVLVTLAVFARVGGLGYIRYDDPLYVEHPRVMQGLTAENVLWAFVATDAANWHPLTWLSHMLDAHLWGSDPRPAHLVNAVLHAINALVLFLVLDQLTKRPWLAWVTAALFALHPLRVESVAWVAERKDLLCALFCFLTIGAYAACVRRPSGLRYLAVVGCFLLAVMSKPMAVTLPCVLLLLDYWPLGRLRIGTNRADVPAAPDASPSSSPRESIAGLIGEKLPLFVLSALASFLTMIAQSDGGAVVSLERLSLLGRVGNAAVGYVRYIQKIVWPSGLSIIYPLDTWPTSAVVASLAALAGVTVLVVLAAKRKPFLAVGWFWFLGTLVPVIGLVQVGSQSIADRYTYIPTVGLLIAAVWGVAAVVERSLAARAAAAWGVVAALVVLAVLTQRQLRHWDGGKMALFHRALELNERNAVAHFQVGFELAKQGDAARAMEHAVRARQLTPNYTKPHYLIGNLLRDRGELRAAVDSYRRSVELNPRFWVAWRQLGLAQARLGDYDAAERSLTRALELNPRSAGIRRDLAECSRARSGERAATTKPVS